MERNKDLDRSKNKDTEAKRGIDRDIKAKRLREINRDIKAERETHRHRKRHIGIERKR